MLGASPGRTKLLGLIVGMFFFLLVCTVSVHVAGRRELPRNRGLQQGQLACTRTADETQQVNGPALPPCHRAVTNAPGGAVQQVARHRGACRAGHVHCSHNLQLQSHCAIFVADRGPGHTLALSKKPLPKPPPNEGLGAATTSWRASTTVTCAMGSWAQA